MVTDADIYLHLFLFFLSYVNIEEVCGMASFLSAPQLKILLVLWERNTIALSELDTYPRVSVDALFRKKLIGYTPYQGVSLLPRGRSSILFLRELTGAPDGYKIDPRLSMEHLASLVTESEIKHYLPE